MNGGHKYSLLSFLFAFVFVLGSMAGMNYILQRREERILQESGTEAMESPVAVWQDPQDAEAEETDENAGSNMPYLTVGQMEEVIRYRADAGAEVLHDPVKGQISMEEAIVCGEQWLAEMGFTEGDTEGDTKTLTRRASLGIKESQRIPRVSMEPYYSFWTVRFSGEDIYAVLSVNAVTGRVWDAAITLYHDMPQRISWESLDRFMELTGVQADAENYVEMNDTNTGATLAIRDSDLCAQIKYYDIAVSIADEENEDADIGAESYHITTDGAEVAEYYGGREIRGQRMIEYHLTLAASFSSS